MNIIKAFWLTVSDLSLVTFAAGAATVPAASPSFVDVSAALALARDGDTVQIPAGTATWNSSLFVNRGITIQGAGATSTVITNSMTAWDSALFILNGTSPSAVKRITAIGMKGDLITNGNGKHGTGVLVRGYGMLKRVDHCQFDDLYCAVWAQNSNGLTDHNLIRNCQAAFRHSGFAKGQQYAWNHFRNYSDNAPYNTLNYMFHEDETVELTGDGFLVDQVEANSWVIRYCNVTYREAHGPYTVAQSYGGIDTHGDNPRTRQYSSISVLLYENNFTVNTGAGMDFFKLRGGQAVVFNNRVTTAGGSGGASVALREERDEAQFAGWPQWPDPQYEDRVHNTYIWNNTRNGVVQGPYVTSESVSHMHFGSDPVSDPTAVAWTTTPASLASLLPAYPHPLATSANSSGAPEHLGVLPRKRSRFWRRDISRHSIIQRN